MYKHLIICCFLFFFACRTDNNRNEKELIEAGDDTAVTEALPLESTDEILDVPEVHRGEVKEVDGKYVILAPDFIEATLKEDYNTVANVKDIYAETFKITSRKTGDTPAADRDSVVTMKYKTSVIEFRKRAGKRDQLLLASLKDEVFLLQNGLRPGIDRAEALAKFGITEQIPQDTIEVVSDLKEDKIILFLKKDTLIKIEIVPSGKEAADPGDAAAD